MTSAVSSAPHPSTDAAAATAAAATAGVASLSVSSPPVTQASAGGGGGSGTSSGGGAAVADGPASALQLLRSFQATQEERSQLYSRLLAGHKVYLSGRDEVAFQALMRTVTQGFAECSRKVMAVEGTLKAAPVERPELATLLRRVQEGEREKLQVTVSMQALRTAMLLRAERRGMQQQQAAEAAIAASSSSVTSYLVTGAGAAAGGSRPFASRGAGASLGGIHQHGAGCGCGSRQGGAWEDEEDEVEEASEEECDLALREMMVRLDRVVAGINDALEEVAQARLDMEEEEGGQQQ